MRGVVAALLAAWALIAGVFAQDDDFAAPPAPADGILDEARMLQRDPARHRALAESLADLEAKHGFRMYYVLYDTLISSSAGERAMKLQQAWLGDKPGIVLVLETDRGIFRFGQAMPKQERIGPIQSLERPDPSSLSAFALADIIRTIEPKLKEAKDRGEFSEKLGIGVAQGILQELDKRAAEPQGGTRVRMVILAIGLIAGTGLAALLVVAGLKRAESKAQERYLFPKVNVGMRLGAPYGGGKVSSRSFGGRPQG
jgi:hypothetical protein